MHLGCLFRVPPPLFLYCGDMPLHLLVSQLPNVDCPLDEPATSNRCITGVYSWRI